MTGNKRPLTKETACNLLDYTPFVRYMLFKELCVTLFPRSLHLTRGRRGWDRLTDLRLLRD